MEKQADHIYQQNTVWEGRVGFHFRLLSKTKQKGHATICIWTLSVLLRKLYWLSVCFSVGISGKLSNIKVLSVSRRFLTALEVRITFFTDLFEGWPVSTFSLIPLKSSVLFVSWLLSFIWKIALFGGHGYSSLSVHSACEVYSDRSARKWQHGIFLAVKGCAWRCLVWWEQAVCQNCCWFPKRLLGFASGVPWWLWLLLGPRIPGCALPSRFPQGTARDAGALTAAAPVPAQRCRSAAAFVPVGKRQPASLCAQSKGSREQRLLALCLRCLHHHHLQLQDKLMLFKGQHIPNTPSFGAFFN